jgi:Nucleotidyl transferase AbiEii toxin, Type IV TA system
MNSDDLIGVLKDLVQRLKSTDVSFYLTGGLVSSYYGEPRFTQDIDFVLQIISIEDADKLKDIFESDYFLDSDLLMEAVRQNGMTQLLHEETFIRIDLHIGELVPGTFLRSHEVELFPNVFVPILSKEDAILTKLRWIQLGSHKSRRDIVMMLRRNTPTNLTFLHEQAQIMGLEELLNELQRQSEGT